MNLIAEMFVEPTAHSIIDSGSIYGRAYQQNAGRNLSAEPQAKLTLSEWGPEVTVSTYHHLEACLEEDELCRIFNLLECDVWNSEFYGINVDQQLWLEEQGFEAEGACWNSYNWENNFDQILQGQKFERDGDEYVLLQVHGGCDARSGYTDAKLFKLQNWMEDYFMRDDARFDISRADAEAAGYPVTETVYDDSDWLSITIYGSHLTVYDPRLSDDVDVDKDVWAKLPHQVIEGVQDAVEH